MSDESQLNGDYVLLTFPSLSENVGFARTTAAVYASRLGFTLDDIDEIKVAVSEAVSNAVIHAYGQAPGMISMRMHARDETLTIEVSDTGSGIEDVEWALQATHTSRPDEQMGLGFVFMGEYMDDLAIDSNPGRGTHVLMKKNVVFRDDPR